MPELPEVTIIATQLNNILNNKTINSIQIVGGRYKSHGPPDGWKILISELPLIVQGVYNKGKMIWFEFKNSDIILCNRLGMSGIWNFYNESSINIKSSINSINIESSINSINIEYPKHAAVEFNIENNEDNEDNITTLIYEDMRRFGTFKIFDKKSFVNELARVGPAFIQSDFPSYPEEKQLTEDQFVYLISKKKRSKLARALMDQSVASGIGNYILSEILYMSKIYPFAMVRDISEKDIRTIYKNALQIIVDSLNEGGVSIRDYKDLNGVKGDGQKGLKVYNQDYDPLGNEVVREEGPHKRTIHWIPEIQIIGKFE